jgi:hypothetical protein
VITTIVNIITLPHTSAVHVDSHSLPLSTLYHHRNSTTTHCHHSYAHSHACKSHKLPQTTHFGRAQMTATCRLGSRFFFLVVSSFYKLPNRNVSFLGSILLVTTGANTAQPMPTPTCTTPPPRPNGM